MLRLVRRLAVATPSIVGSPWTFLLAIFLTLLWVVWGPFAALSETWLLVPSAIASVFTFLIACSLQYTQNRDTRAIQLKLDEILRAEAGARSELVKLERMSDEQLTEIEEQLIDLSEEEMR
jgi:low affinity Fe/Cu permease